MFVVDGKSAEAYNNYYYTTYCMYDVDVRPKHTIGIGIDKQLFVSIIII